MFNIHVTDGKAETQLVLSGQTQVSYAVRDLHVGINPAKSLSHQSLLPEQPNSHPCRLLSSLISDLGCALSSYSGAALNYTQGERRFVQLFVFRCQVGWQTFCCLAVEFGVGKT